MIQSGSFRSSLIFFVSMIAFSGCGGSKAFRTYRSINNISDTGQPDPEALGKVTGFNGNQDLSGLVCQLNAQSGVILQVYVGNEIGQNGSVLVNEIRATLPIELSDLEFTSQCAKIGASFRFIIPYSSFQSRVGQRVFVYAKSLKSPGQLIKLDNSGNYLVPNSELATTTTIINPTTTTTTTIVNPTNVTTTTIVNSHQSCQSGYYMSNGVCRPQICSPNATSSQACSIGHGTGTQSRSCASNGSAWGAFGTCNLASCDAGYYMSGGVCVAQVCAPNATSSQACSSGHGSGLQSRSCAANGSAWGTFGTCLLSSCNEGYYMKDGECLAQVCSPNTASSQACSSGHGTGTQSRSCASNGSAWGAFGTCSLASCDAGYYMKDGACLAQVCSPRSESSQACAVEHGTGSKARVCAANGSSWGEFGSCRAISCQSGYFLQDGVCSKPGPLDPVVKEPRKTGAAKPHGYFDGLKNNNLHGWACQTDIHNSLYVKVYAGTTLSNKKLVGQFIANNPDDPGVIDSCSSVWPEANQYKGNHRFIIPASVLSSAKKGDHIFVFAVTLGKTEETRIPFGNIPGFSVKVP